MNNIILVLLFLLMPLLIIYLCERFGWVNKVGAILWAYAAGILLRVLGVVPETPIDPVVTMADWTIAQWFANLTIPLALPLLLFSLDFRKWLKQAKKVLLSMILAFISVVVMVVMG